MLTLLFMIIKYMSQSCWLMFDIEHIHCEITISIMAAAIQIRCRARMLAPRR
jgi:hypothetical protein